MYCLHILIPFLISFQTQFNVTGEWEYQTSSYSFSLTLIQTEDSVRGHYCAIADNGNRIDCHVYESDSCNLQGRFINSKAEIRFKSCYIGATGKASITYNEKNDKLLWKLKKTSGEVFAPNSIELKRKK